MIKINERQKKYMFTFIAGGIILLYLAFSIMGFRWASTYVRTNHVITWKYGYIPRALANHIAAFFLGDRLYSQAFLNIWILGIAGLFLLYIIFSVIETVAIRRNMLCMVVFFAFSISPYAKYYLHEAGYYEQYGYLLGIVLLETARKKKWSITFACAVVFAFLSTLFSETNLFLIIPFLFSIAFLEIVEQNEKTVKRTILLLAGFVPAIVYSLLAFFIKVPRERMEKMEEWNRQSVDFSLRNDVYQYFWDDRSVAEIWGRELRPIPVPCVIYPLIFAAVIAFILYQVNKKVAISYFLVCILCGLANYSIVIVAWDLDRYYFCIFMQVFMITIYVIKKYLIDYELCRRDMAALLLLIIMALGMTKFEFKLFDDKKYLRSLQDLLEKLKKISHVFS